MKKICGVSLIALLVGASFNAYANIASTGYVDSKIASLDSETAATSGKYLTGITITDGKITGKTEGTPAAYTLPDATTSVKGGVTVDGSTITATSGKISVGSITSAKVSDFNTAATTAADGAITTSIASGAIKTALDGKLDTSSVTESYSPTGTSPVNGKAVASAISGAASNYAAKSTQTAVENATTGLSATNKLASEALQNASVTGDGNVITTVSEDASHNLVATRGLTAVTTVGTTGTGSVLKSVTQSGASVTATLGTISNADVASDAAIAKTKLASDVQTSLGLADSAVQTVTTSGTTGVVTGVSANTNGTVTVTKSEIVNADIAAGAAIAMSKIAMPDSTVTANVTEDGTYVLTMKLVSGTPTYTWENIARTVSE